MPLPAPPLISTGTALDDWLGGIPQDGIVLVQGAPGCGRTMFLHAVAEGISTTGTKIYWNGTKPVPPRRARSFAFDVATHSTLEGLADHVDDMNVPSKSLVVIDDAMSYSCQNPTAGTSTREWSRLVRSLSALRAPVLVAATTRGVGSTATTGIGRGILYTAALILELEPVARTAGKDDGVVVEARIIKSRRHGVGEVKQLWLRPHAEEPFIFA